MENPILAARTRKGLSRLEAARLTGIDYTSLAMAEVPGYYHRIPPRILRGLPALGLDPDEAQAQYQLWRQEQAAAIAGR